VFALTNNLSQKKLQQRMYLFSGIFLLLLSIILTFSPAVKYRIWAVEFIYWHWIGFSIWLVCSLLFYKTLKKHLPEADSFLFLTTNLITGWGLITIWRLNPFFGFRQTLWIVICTIISIVLIRTPNILDFFKRYKYSWLFIGLVLIGLTFFFGTYPNGVGPKLWLGFGGVYIQPSEFLKIILIVYLASYFSEKQSGKFDLVNTIIPTAVLVFASLAILISQKDLGTALIFIVIYILILYFVFGKRRILLFGFLLLVLSAVLGYALIDLIRIRFQGWILPWGESTQSNSYQIVQSIISIAAGGLFGTGIGLGYPNLVPLTHSDFIFTAIVEETGLFGGIGLLSLILIFLFRGIMIAIEVKDRFHRYLAFGITVYIITQSVLIIGGNTRLFPITGVTLPFVSYGGSSLLTSYIALSMLLKISAGKKMNAGMAKKSKRINNILVLFSLCFLAIAFTIGWWGIIRSDDLQGREDNPRHLISNTYVKRGNILDRNNISLAETIGTPGFYKRYIGYTPLSNTIGYIHQKYGLISLESEFDDYLSGMKGYPAKTLWWNYLLYDQPPDGRAIRSTIDLNLQKTVDNLLSRNTGAAVVMNPENGEIFAISTYPFIDANTLDEQWDEWKNSEDAPFLNRASQGAYPVGGLVAPLLLYDHEISRSANFRDSGYFFDFTKTSQCNKTIMDGEDWQLALSYGCLSAVSPFTGVKDPYSISRSPEFSYLFNPPRIGLPVNLPFEISSEMEWNEFLTEEVQLRSSPLQIAASYSPLSNGGYLVEPVVISSINISTGQWVALPKKERQHLIGNETVDGIVDLLESNNRENWEISAVTFDSNDAYSWIVIGSIFSENSSPIIITAVIESDNRELVQSIGRKIYNAVVS
jgi:cell division protein FtsW (lipid II flippase)